MRKATYNRRRKKRRFKLIKNTLFILLIILVGIAIPKLKTQQGQSTLAREISFEEESETLESGKVTVDKTIIVIDAGHGGIDAGAEVNDILEKEINLEIALKLQDALETAGYEVVMTRENDEALELAERADIANEANADLFISLHLNSYIADSTVNGIEVYYNETTKPEEDELFAQAIQTAVSEATNAKDRGIRDYDELAVTRRTEMPACLIEMAFMTNPTELELIQTDTYQYKVVSGIVTGIENFLSSQENSSISE